MTTQNDFHRQFLDVLADLAIAGATSERVCAKLKISKATLGRYIAGHSCPTAVAQPSIFHCLAELLAEADS